MKTLVLCVTSIVVLLGCNSDNASHPQLLKQLEMDSSHDVEPFGLYSANLEGLAQDLTPELEHALNDALITTDPHIYNARDYGAKSEALSYIDD